MGNQAAGGAFQPAQGNQQQQQARVPQGGQHNVNCQRQPVNNQAQPGGMKATPYHESKNTGPQRDSYQQSCISMFQQLQNNLQDDLGPTNPPNFGPMSRQNRDPAALQFMGTFNMHPAVRQLMLQEAINHGSLDEATLSFYSREEKLQQLQLLQDQILSNMRSNQ